MKNGWKAFVPAILLAFSIAITFLYASGSSELLPAGQFVLFLYHAFISKFLFVAVLLLAAYGVGGAAFGRILPGFTDILEEFLFKSALGLAVISYAVLLAALLGLVYPATGFLLIAACLAAGFREVRGLFLKCHGAWPASGPSVFSVVLGGVSFYFLLHGLLGALLPPTGFDVLMYHMGVPKLYLNAHRMFPTPDINGSSFPFGGEMLYLLGMMVNGPIATNLVNYSFAVLGGLAAASFTRRFLPGVAPVASFAVYVCVPLVVWLMPQAYIELALAFYSMLALHALAAGFIMKDRKWLVVAAVTAGFTMAIKYTGALLIGVVFSGVFLYYLLVEKQRLKAVLHALVLSCIALAACLPWYIRNIVFYSNPLYPFLAGIFNGAHAAGSNVPPYSGLWAGGVPAAAYKLVSYLWDTTLRPPAYQVGWVSGIGPYFLMFIPGLVFFRNIPRVLKYLLILCIALFIVIIAGTQENLRYVTPILPALSVLAAYPMGRLINEGTKKGRVMATALAAVFALAALAANTGWAVVAGYPSSGREAQDHYYMDMAQCQGYLASYPAWKWIDENLPKDAVVYQLWDDASVYFRTRKTFGAAQSWGEYGRQKIHYIRGFKSGFECFLPGQEIIENLKKMGAGYLLVNANREGHCLPEDPYFIQHTNIIYQNGGIFLFRIN